MLFQLCWMIKRIAAIGAGENVIDTCHANILIVMYASMRHSFVLSRGRQRGAGSIHLWTSIQRGRSGIIVSNCRSRILAISREDEAFGGLAIYTSGQTLQIFLLLIHRVVRDLSVVGADLRVAELHAGAAMHVIKYNPMSTSSDIRHVVFDAGDVHVDREQTVDAAIVEVGGRGAGCLL